MQRRTALLLLPAASLLGACGFQLRQAPTYDFKTLYSGFSPSSSLGLQFRRALGGTGSVVVITDNKQINDADVLLDVVSDLRQKVVVGINASGQVREFQLRLIFKFRLRRKDGTVLIPDTEITQQRDLSFNEGAALAKESEELLLYRDMEKDVVNQMLRRLSTIKVANPA